MEDHLGVNQSRLLLAEFRGGETMFLQITGAPIREEHVGIPQQTIELGTIFFGAIQDRGAHPDLHVPHKGLYVRIIRPPDVEDVRAIECEVPPDASAGNDVTHAERANALQGTLCSAFERYRLTVSDFLQSDERHSGEHFGVHGLFEKLLSGTYL